jgi:hypothetical protein
MSVSEAGGHNHEGWPLTFGHDGCLIAFSLVSSNPQAGEDIRASVYGSVYGRVSRGRM